MDLKYQELSERILKRAGTSTDNKTLTLISGPPGSGKSTLAKNVAQIVNRQYFLSHNMVNKQKVSQGNNHSTIAKPVGCDITTHPIYTQILSKISDCSTGNNSESLENLEYPIFLLNQPVANNSQKNKLDVFSLIENENIGFVPIRKRVSLDKSSIILSRRSMSNRIKISLFKYPKDTEDLKNHQTKNVLDTQGNTVVISMDGFHYPTSLFVPESPVSEMILSRRGCPASFDAYMVVQLVEILKFLTAFLCEPYNSLQESYTFFEISVPSFNHENKDPKPNGILIRTDIHKNFIMEGLYLSLLLMEPWCEISRIVQQNHDGFRQQVYNTCEAWFIRAKSKGESNDNSFEFDEETKVYMKRVGKRHLEADLVSNLDEGYLKFLNNDLLNCELIMKNYQSTNGKNIDLTVESIDV